MKIGDLVKFVGVANYYKDSMGIITKMYNTHGIKKNGQLYMDTAVVYIAGKPEGRSLPGLGQAGIPCFHPLCLTEIEAIN
jgi:acyl-CoA hydrolase